jgi:hypothetical protein
VAEADTNDDDEFYRAVSRFKMAIAYYIPNRRRLKRKSA